MKKYNEKDLINFSKEQVNYLNNFTSEKGTISDIYADSLPCWIHCNSLADISMTYLNKAGLMCFQESLDEIKKKGVEFVQSIVHPESTKVVVPLLIDFTGSNNYTKILFFEQKVKYKYEHEYKNHLSFSILNKVLNSILTVTFPAYLLEDFFKLRLFPEDKIFEKYYEGVSSLSKREREIFEYIAIGKTNKQISDLLYISQLTVKTHRRNIINKLHTSNISDLARIAAYFNFIDKH
ncbi:MAG: helix-turn-helix transcriptional regulator [Ignavibacteriaceae bacterium]